jgi:ribosomal protein L37AE/L43A
MIEISELKDTDIGRWVKFDKGFRCEETGRIKSFNSLYVYVVFKCDGNWDNFGNYTAEATNPERLEFIEIEKDNKEKPCPYCKSVKNEFGTCSWHCLTCENKFEDCSDGCNSKHEETEKDEVVSGYRYIGDPVLDEKIEWAKISRKTIIVIPAPL